MKTKTSNCLVVAALSLLFGVSAQIAVAQDIVHDAEYYIIEAQLALMNPEAEQSDITRGLWSDGSFPDELVLDQTFTFKAGDMLTVDRLVIAENTIIMVMGDNGTMTNYMGLSGAADRIYRGGKGEHLEGGVRVNAYIRWPGMIEAGSMAEDIVHVSDVYTSMARLAGATDEIPRDRIIDGVDQSGVLLLGETHGRRDYVYIYEQDALKSIVKNKYKFHLAPPMTNPILSAGFYDLYRDSREERPEDGIKMGTWASGQFSSMLKRHMGWKKKYPDRKPISATPYEGVENLRPETQRMVDAFLASRKGKPQA